MNKKSLRLLPALLLFSAGAYAGYTQPASVTITPDPYPGTDGLASGDMIAARNSKNKWEFIGCGIRAYDDGAGGAFHTGFCQAGLEEEAGTSVVCTTQNLALMEGINILSDSSYITFAWVELDDGFGGTYLECTRIGSSTQSFYLEKG